MGRYLILGGTGRTGRRVLDRLTAQGDSTIIVSRHASSGKQPGIQDQTIVTGDLAAGLDPSLLDEVDGVVITVEPPTDPRQAAKVMNDGVAALARDCGERGVRIVLVSQIYITRAAAHPDLAAIITARGDGERALRASGAPYVIVRPGWLTDGPAAGVRIEQGDTGEGQVSRDTVADAIVTALKTPRALATTFEIYDGPGDPPISLSEALSELLADRPVSVEHG